MCDGPVYLLQRIPAVPSRVFISPPLHSLGVEAFVSLSDYLQPIVLENPRDKGLAWTSSLCLQTHTLTRPVLYLLVPLTSFSPSQDPQTAPHSLNYLR